MKKPNNADQEKYWSSPPGQQWIRFEEELDTAFLNVTATLLAAAKLKSGEKVLDIGCGTGASSLEMARSVGPGGAVVALDISQPLLDRAKERGEALGLTQLSYQHGDAQELELPEAHFDVLASRFGVMFFSNPTKAFANMHRAMQAKGRMVFASWASMAKNPWFSIPRTAAVGHLGEPEPSPRRSPGPLAFAETDYVSEILRDAGFQNVTASPTAIKLQPKGGLDGAASLASNVGMASRVMHEYNGTDADLQHIISDVRTGFSAFETPNGVNIPAIINIFTADV